MIILEEKGAVALAAPGPTSALTETPPIPAFRVATGLPRMRDQPDDQDHRGMQPAAVPYRGVLIDKNDRYHHQSLSLERCVGQTSSPMCLPASPDAPQRLGPTPSFFFSQACLISTAMSQTDSVYAALLSTISISFSLHEIV